MEKPFLDQLKKIIDYKKKGYNMNSMPGLEVIKLEFILRLKIKRNDWLLADTCPQAANRYGSF